MARDPRTRNSLDRGRDNDLPGMLRPTGFYDEPARAPRAGDGFWDSKGNAWTGSKDKMGRPGYHYDPNFNYNDMIKEVLKGMGRGPLPPGMKTPKKLIQDELPHMCHALAMSMVGNAGQEAIMQMMMDHTMMSKARLDAAVGNGVPVGEGSAPEAVGDEGGAAGGNQYSDTNSQQGYILMGWVAWGIAEMMLEAEGDGVGDRASAQDMLDIVYPVGLEEIKKSSGHPDAVYIITEATAELVCKEILDAARKLKEWQTQMKALGEIALRNMDVEWELDQDKKRRRGVDDAETDRDEDRNRDRDQDRDMRRRALQDKTKFRRAAKRVLRAVIFKR